MRGSASPGVGDKRMQLTPSFSRHERTRISIAMRKSKNVVWWSVRVSVVLLACISFLLPKASSAAAENYVVVGEQQSGTLAKLTLSQVLIIQLPSQPSTGFGWTVTKFDQSACKVEELTPEQVKLLHDNGTLVKPKDTGLLGAVEHQVFQLTPLSKGTTKIQLWYARPWESRPPAKQFSLTVRIGT
jgi:inhibitor of cysteine peptidase